MPELRRIHTAPRQQARARSATRAMHAIFVSAFLGSCCWFWWMQSLVYRAVLRIDDPVTDSTLVLSFTSVALFLAGYFLPVRIRLASGFSRSTVNQCEVLSRAMTVWLFPVALLIAVTFYVTTSGVAYGESGNISFVYQIVFYLHLFVGFMYLGVADADHTTTRQIALASLYVVLPRVIVSMHYGRSFLAEGVVPVIFILIARGFLRPSLKRIGQLIVLALFIVLVPSLTRGDQVFSADDNTAGAQMPQIVRWLVEGSSLQITQDYMHLDMSQKCPPLLVSLTDKIIPWVPLHACTVVVHGTPTAANMDRIVSHEIDGDGSRDDPATGTGTSYLLELYVTGGVAAVVLGSFLFGVLCRAFATAMAGRSLFTCIWAECLVRAVWSPRSMLGYVFEKIPGMVVATIAFVVISFVFTARRTETSTAPDLP